VEKFKFLAKNKISNLPKTPGIYAFKKGRKFLYIGKAINLKERVKQHVELLGLAEQLAYIETKSEVEALILEAKLIKKYQPKYNTAWKDDKNYFYVGVTKEEFPRVFITHQPRKIRNSNIEIRNKSQIQNSKSRKTVSDFVLRASDFEWVGPFVNGRELKQKLKELRKIHPYRTCKTLPKKPCLWFHLNKCLAPCLLRSRRIEAYDISNIQGQQATGSMVTFINSRPDKNLYRLFKIKMENKPNDTAMLKEVLQRRLKHKEWGLPDLLLIDGGKAQLNAALSVTKIPVMALAKKKNELYLKGQQKPVLLENLPREIFNLILQLRDEAHRFARNYHLKLRKKALLG